MNKKFYTLFSSAFFSTEYSSRGNTKTLINHNFMGQNLLRTFMVLAAFVVTLTSFAQQRGPGDRLCTPHPGIDGATLTRQPKRLPMTTGERQAYLNSQRGGPTGESSLVCSELIVDGGFEAGGIPSTFWNPETSSNFGTPLCDVASCGTGGGASPPRTGNIWAWFGGIPAPETATLGETMVIPVGTASLTFWMRIGTVSAPFTDVLNVRVDGVIVQSFTEPAVAEAAYTLRTINLNAYANGASHLVLFEYIGPSSGTGSFVVDDVSLQACLLPQSLIISEFRLRGPNGANDEFIEVYNNSTTPVTVASTDGSSGCAVVASDGTTRFVIPNGTIIPARGHYLGVNSVGYSIASYPAGNGTTATGDATYATDIPDNAGIALFSTSNPVNFILANRLDAVGSTSEANVLYKEGTGYPALTPFSIDYCFHRKVNTGIPQETDNNAADFKFEDTNGTSAGAGQQLGAPGPENLSGPISAGTSLLVKLADPAVSPFSAPNWVRDLTSVPANNSTFGTVSLRYCIKNIGAAPITRLRLRIDSLTTFPSPSGTADLRPITSADVIITVPSGPVTARGMTLEQPPSQPNGGGFNSSVSAGIVTLGTPIAVGDSIFVHLLSGVQQTGFYTYSFTAEALPQGGGTTPTASRGSTDAAPCVLTCPANITVSNNPNQCGAVVNYPAPITSGGCGTVTATPASGSFFPVGTTTVNVTSTAGPTCSFTIRVNDTQAPAVTCPANVTVSNTAGLCSAVVNFTVTATDNCPGVTVVNTPASGSVFPVGTTTVNSTATDAAGNTATCSFTVRVNDTENPTFSSPGLFPERLYYKFDGSGTTVPNLATAPPAGTATATLIGETQGGAGKCGGALIGTGVANQSLNTNWVTNMAAPWTISFWLGANQVDMNPSYLFGDINAGAFRCFYGGAALPGNILLRGGSGDVLINGVNPAATLITIVYNGTNTVVYKNGAAPQTFNVTFANAGAGPFRVGGYSNLASVNGLLDEFSMYTRALTPAEVLSLFNTCPANVSSCPANISVNNAPGTCGAVVTYTTPVATDNCPGVVITRTAGLASGSTFPVGVTTVTHRATDAAGNIANCTFTVTVNDNQVPTITCPGNITVNTPVGSCTAVVPYTVTSADNCPGVIQALQSGLASNAVYPIGVTTNVWRATDASGNIATCTFTVTVRDGQLPVISAQPLTKTVCVGTNSDMSITVSNAVSYQWQQWNGTAWVNIAGGTAATLPLNSVTLAMNTNTYRVLVNGLCTNLISNVASLYVNALPTITLTTTKATLTPGETTSITAVVKPTGGTITWTHNGSPIGGGFTLSGLGIDDIGTYRAVYTDLNGCKMTSNDLVINALSTNNLYVMPNPNNGQFQVRFYATNTGAPLTLTVYSSSGSKVYQQKMTSNQPYSAIDVDLGQTAGGIYMVEVHDADGKKIAARKIVVRAR